MTTRSDSNQSNPLSYSAYLVRMWQDTPGNPWRASAQSVQSGETMRFSSLQALFEYLGAQTTGSLCARELSGDHDAPTEP